MSNTEQPVPQMGPFLQARLWATQATATERVFAALCAAVAVALVAWALVPPAGDVVASANVDARADGAVASGSDASVFPVNGEGPTPESGDVTGGGSGGGTSSQATRSAPNGRTGTTTVTTPGPLTASDRGVTPSSVRVGLVVLNLGGLEAAGIAAGLRGDARQAIAALVADANKRGGVEGRRIEPVVKSIDVLSEDDQRRKCLEFTQTDKVFAIVDTVGFLTEPTKACVAVENDTPLYTAVPGSAREMAKAAPYQISPKKDHSRAVRDYVAAAKEAGFFDPARGFKRLGLVTDECELDTLADLKAALAAAGVKNVSEFRAACDLASQRAVGAPAVLQHQRDGVSHVFFGLANPAVTNYTGAAKNANYRPRIFVSDWWTLSTDSSAEDFDPEVFDGAQAVTATIDGDAAVGKPLPELMAKCSRALEAAGIPPMTGAPADIEIAILCEHLELFQVMARSAGAVLTRRGMTEGIHKVGVFRGSTIFQSNFDRPGKYTGGDLVKLSVWKRSCTCWQAASAYRAAHA